jgi:uncharacterized membrane-anchored protein
VVPVDPRSLFRGDYARLGYTISAVPKSDLPERSLRNTKTPVYVTIQQQPDGAWRAVSASLSHPGKVSETEAVLKGRPAHAWQTLTRPNIDIAYGIERYYVPEGKGLELERMVRDKKIAAIIAVDARGNAAIKGLAIDGKRIYDEPLL